MGTLTNGRSILGFSSVTGAKLCTHTRIGFLAEGQVTWRLLAQQILIYRLTDAM